MSAIIDARQRQKAIDPQRSFIVQAPAGSGKTELLIQRFLALLSQVERPDRILAMTFTRKAAAEMRNRLLESLAAAEGERPQEAHRAQTFDLARAALEQDRRLGWNLLLNPEILSIQTIDSFNAGLVRKMPWVCRLGGLPEIVEDASLLYLEATQNLLRRLGTPQVGALELEKLLAHLDNQMEFVQQMLVDMLGKRDQWMRHLYRIEGLSPQQILEKSLADLIEKQLGEIVARVPTTLGAEMLACGRIAALNLYDGKERPLLALADAHQFPAALAGDLPIWQGLADLLLTGNNTLRRSGGINVNLGFAASQPVERQRMQRLVSDLSSAGDFIEKLVACRVLPQPRYPAQQWQILECLILLLPQLVAELWLVFRRAGQVDFSEISLMASSSLGSSDDPGELLLRLDSVLHHILVDEFQDTSEQQYALLQQLTSGWQPGDGRTLFVVGDPMQSIYRFREAEVGLFLKTFSGRLGTDGPQLEPLQLQANFRSQQGIVDWVNRSFAEIFPTLADVGRGAVPLASAVAVRPALEAPALSLYAFVERADQAEAVCLVDQIEQAQAQDSQQTLAILVRSRTHLPEILRELRRRHISFQAQDIDLLGCQPMALDILALTRALLHPGDRLAWLSLLRAPWCGLLLADLLILSAAGFEASLYHQLLNPALWARLSPDAQERIAQILPVIKQALAWRGTFPLRQVVEGCWLALGGPGCYDHEVAEEARLVFDALERVAQGGALPNFDCFEREIARLYVQADPDADGRLQIMTIHKAKGLEFDQVFLPGLGRSPATDKNPLLRWLEHPDHGLLLAPVAARDGSDQDPIYRLISQLEKDKGRCETGRLLYVAATRARNRLHLFGHARLDKNEELKPAADTLLEKLWPVISDEFCARAQPQDAEETPVSPVFLRRLSPGWCLPQLAAALETTAVSLAAHPVSEAERALFSGWEKQTNRHVGTLVHEVFEQLANKGIDAWSDEDSARLKPQLVRRLICYGVPVDERPPALQRIFNALELARSSTLGRWILADHPMGSCELALSGVVDQRLVHAVIDRSFIDDGGRRWVIDYKTSMPLAHESREAFVAREVEHYRAQLQTYVHLFRSLEPERTFCAALYFPLIDHFVEVENV